MKVYYLCVNCHLLIPEGYGCKRWMEKGSQTICICGADNSSWVRVEALDCGFVKGVNRTAPKLFELRRRPEPVVMAGELPGVMPC